MAQLLILRCDANSQIGVGHLSRLLSLAEAWQRRGGKTVLLGQIEPQIYQSMLAKTPIHFESLSEPREEVAEMEHLRRVLHRHGATATAKWICFDGYHFSNDDYQRARELGLKVCTVEDYSRLAKYNVDVLVNPSIAELPTAFHCNKETIPCLGHNYLLLRKYFWECPAQSRVFPEGAKRLVVVMGGTDSRGAIPRVLRALDTLGLKDLEVKVLTVSGRAHIQTTMSDFLPQLCYRVEVIAGMNDIRQHFEWADLAICGAGSVCNELAYLGVPMAYLQLTDNQQLAALAWERKTAGWNLGRADEVSTAQLAEKLLRVIGDQNLRREISTKAHSLVDGRGALRLAAELYWFGLNFRPATVSDCQFFFDLATDPAARNASFAGTKELTWDHHVSWFHERLDQQSRITWVANDGSGQPIGVVRLDPATESEQMVISINVAPTQRGQGAGKAIIRAASRELFRIRHVHGILAYIKPENESSRAAFEGAGYTSLGEAAVQGQKALLYTIRQESL